MVKKSPINSLQELQQRKKEVRLDLELAKREFAHTLGTSRSNLGSFLLKKVAAPVGGVGLGVIALNKLLSGSSGNHKGREIVRETRVIHQYPDGTPVGAERTAPVRLSSAEARKNRRRGLTIGTLVGAAKLLIPVIQAIIGSISAHKAEQHAKEAKVAAKQR